MRESLEEFERERQRVHQELQRRSKCEGVDSDRGSQLLRIRQLQFEIGDLERDIRKGTDELLRLRIIVQTTPNNGDISSRISDVEIRRDQTRSELRRAESEMDRAKNQMSELRSEFIRNSCEDWFDLGPNE